MQTVFRSALGPNQILFSHSQDPNRAYPAQNSALSSRPVTPVQHPTRPRRVWYRTGRISVVLSLWGLHEAVGYH
jgi:hypothetical protein